MNKKAFALAGVATLFIVGAVVGVILGFIFAPLVTLIILGCIVGLVVGLFVIALIWDGFYTAFGGRK